MAYDLTGISPDSLQGENAQSGMDRPFHQPGWGGCGFSGSVRVFEAVPHVEDEMAYVWQAKVLAHGQITAPTPPEPQSMYVPFVVDANGHRSAKYPPGWPMVLALGILLGIRTWVNPLLGGLAVWLTFPPGSKNMQQPDRFAGRIAHDYFPLLFDHLRFAGFQFLVAGIKYYFCSCLAGYISYGKSGRINSQRNIFQPG